MSTRPERDETMKAAPRAGPSVLAVVATHDGRTWLRDCLVALADQSYSALDILVVDDASSDSDREPRLARIVKRHLKRLERRGARWGVVRTPRSLGFGGAVNWALSRVRTDADYLLLLHDDAVLTRDSVKEMVARLSGEEQAAVVGPKIVAWHDPATLEEVGMAVDRFGYPYKGLEEGELDLGQHDRASEVFFVTSTCMLIRHDVFRKLRGWDARLGAFSEDLDLCWRARLAGYTVRYEPKAKARHAIAMATGLRRTRFRRSRYFIRRNRMRTITKNASTLRLLLLIPQFVLLTFAEMLGFLALRQPREVGNLAHALAWNALHFPQTLRERARVQRLREVPDRMLQRLTVREIARLHAYVMHQRGVLEEAWGRRAEVVATRTVQARTWGRRMQPWQVVAALALVVGVLLGFRDFLWSPPASIGELLPYPQGGFSMFAEWASPWRSVGAGSPGPSPPAFFALGIPHVLALGAEGAAQKLLVILLGVTAFVGAARLTSELTDRLSRLVAGLVYVLGPVGYAAMRTGSVGALVFGAAAPFVLHSLLRMAGWTRPPLWSGPREIARLMLFSGVSAAFVPGSLALYALAAVLLTGARMILGRPLVEIRALIGSVVGLGLGWVLLLPWSSTWFSEGQSLALLGGAEEAGEFARSFAGHGMLSVLAGQTPGGPPLFGLALPLLGIIAVVVGEGQRRRVALALWAVVVATGVAVTATATGALPPLLANPLEMGVLSAVAYAGLAGLAVAAFRLDLPRKRLGAMQFVTVAALAGALLLMGAGLAPAFWRGEWGPGKGTGAENPATVAQISTLLETEAAGVGRFRALWIGRGWTSGVPTEMRPQTTHFLTDSAGQKMTDLFPAPDSAGEIALDGVVDAVTGGATDRAGRLLGGLNVRYVVLERGPAATPWLNQRDLATARAEPDFVILKRDDHLDRAALYNELPAGVSALEGGDTATADTGIERKSGRQENAAEFSIPDASGPGVVFLAESRDPRWTASLEGRALDRSEGGWGNAFTLPASTAGDVTVNFPRSAIETVFLVAVPLVWAFMVGAAFPSRAPQRRRRTR